MEKLTALFLERIDFFKTNYFRHMQSQNSLKLVQDHVKQWVNWLNNLLFIGDKDINKHLTTLTKTLSVGVNQG